MIALGKFNKLKIAKIEGRVVSFDGGDLGEIQLLPADAQKDYKEADELNIFVYYAGKGKLQGSTRIPFAQVDDVAYLKCVSESHAGAFLDWGLAKDLLLPFSEQTGKVVEGRYYLVKIFLDEDNLIAASMLLEDFIDEEGFYFKPGQEVDLVIAHETDLGMKAVINNEYWGVLYKNEIFQKLRIGQKIKGYIKKIRDDNKIDLVLQVEKYIEKVDSVTEKILSKLNSQGGTMLITDKSPPEVIYKAFGVSKKVFKQSIGGLYKNKVISISKESISLIKKVE